MAWMGIANLPIFTIQESLVGQLIGGVSLLEFANVLLNHHELEKTQLGLLLDLDLKLVLHLPHHLLMSVALMIFVEPGIVKQVCY